MVKRYNRLLVALHVVSDALLGMLAFLLAYFLRFHTDVLTVTKGVPPLGQYLAILPFVGVLVPLAFHVQGMYRLRRGRSRLDDFFAVLVGSILAVVLGIVSTLYFQAYYLSDALKDRGALEVSQVVWGPSRSSRASRGSACMTSCTRGIASSNRFFWTKRSWQAWETSIRMRRSTWPGSTH